MNWRTDATPAILNDTITVTLAPQAKVLVLDGFDGSYLPNILDILNIGDYHGIEPWVYSECLRKNFHQRINSYRKKQTDKTMIRNPILSIFALLPSVSFAEIIEAESEQNIQFD